MALPLNRRDYDVFLSHAHVDHEFADALYAWLRKAGLSVWYDKVNMAPDTRINEGLLQGIVESRGVLLVATEESVERGWVRDEVAAATDQRNTVPSCCAACNWRRTATTCSRSPCCTGSCAPIAAA
jgi:hypothetical protein